MIYVFFKKKPDAILLLIESGFFCFFRFWVSVYILDRILLFSCPFEELWIIPVTLELFICRKFPQVLA